MRRWSRVEVLLLVVALLLAANLYQNTRVVQAGSQYPLSLNAFLLAESPMSELGQFRIWLINGVPCVVYREPGMDFSGYGMSGHLSPASTNCDLGRYDILRGLAEGH